MYKRSHNADGNRFVALKMSSIFPTKENALKAGMRFERASRVSSVLTRESIGQSFQVLTEQS